MTCKDCIHSGLCYKENDYENFPDRCGSFIPEQPQGNMMKVYIRFGDIPKDFQSKVHKGDAIIRNEGGVSVWNCIQADEDEYYPILPNNPNPHAIADYFRLLFSNKPIYLVTGTEMFLTGADGEPLLMSDVTIIKQLDYSWLKGD